MEFKNRSQIDAIKAKYFYLYITGSVGLFHMTQITPRV